MKDFLAQRLRAKVEAMVPAMVDEKAAPLPRDLVESWALEFGVEDMAGQSMGVYRVLSLQTVADLKSLLLLQIGLGADSSLCRKSCKVMCGSRQLQDDEVLLEAIPRGVTLTVELPEFCDITVRLVSGKALGVFHLDSFHSVKDL